MESYYAKVIKTCHDHGALATGGMAAAIYDTKAVVSVLDGKFREIAKGVDGFLVYDLKFLPDLNDLLTNSKIIGSSSEFKNETKIDDIELLNIPNGKVTRQGLEKNIKVGIMFIASWLSGQGTFILDGNVEDSATAEISRFQVWQWIHHSQHLDQETEKNRQIVDLALVHSMAEEIVKKDLEHPQKNLAYELFMELIQTQTQFITTWLNQNPSFRQISLQSAQ